MKANWKESARRKIVGDAEELKTFPGYWIKPKKYSVTGKDAINDEQRKLQQGIDRRSVASVVKKLKIKADGKTEDQLLEEVMDRLTDDELAAMIDSQFVPSAAYIKIRLMEGIHSHNFCDAAESLDVKTLVNDILDYPEIAGEMLAIVERFNAPLARKSSRILKTPPSGSTEEQSSNGETLSPTDDTPQT